MVIIYEINCVYINGFGYLNVLLNWTTINCIINNNNNNHHNHHKNNNNNNNNYKISEIEPKPLLIYIVFCELKF